eukprot:Pgem_evm1s18707
MRRKYIKELADLQQRFPGLIDSNEHYSAISGYSRDDYFSVRSNRNSVDGHYSGLIDDDGDDDGDGDGGCNQNQS